MLYIMKILNIVSISLEKTDHDMELIFGVNFGSRWNKFIRDLTFTIVAVWLLLEIFNFIFKKLSTASAEQWNDIEEEWVKYLSWFDPNCEKLKYLKECQQKLLKARRLKSLLKLKEALAQVKRLLKDLSETEGAEQEDAVKEQKLLKGQGLESLKEALAQVKRLKKNVSERKLGKAVAEEIAVNEVVAKEVVATDAVVGETIAEQVAQDDT